MTVVVSGQIGRDVVLRVSRLTDAEQAGQVEDRIEVLGGKAANQAVGLAQLGVQVGVAGVVGSDAWGMVATAQAQDDGIDVTRLVRRGSSSLVVSEIDAAGRRRLLEHFPDSSWLTPDDVDLALDGLTSSDVLVLQLQQPSATVAAAVAVARRRGIAVVTDGAPAGDAHDVLSSSAVVRVDAHEASLLANRPISTIEEALDAARSWLALGPRWVAIEVPDQGDLLADGRTHRLVRHGDRVIDRTGGGDAFLAGLTAALVDDLDIDAAAELASAAARSTVARLGGRPDLRHLRPSA